MPSLIEAPDSSQAMIEKLIPLLGSKSLRIIDKCGGGNSAVYCVADDTRQWAVKSYPPYAPGQRDRLSAEVSVYQFLNQHQVPAVPMLRAASEQERWLIIDWIEGEIPAIYSESDVEQCIAFIASVNKLNVLAEAQALPLAAEACLSLTILIEQIAKRLQRLQSLPEKDPALNSFLENEFTPTFEKMKIVAQQGFLANSIDSEMVLPLAKRSLIPADFGFHNAIREASGKLYFFDFDYFGWDDPVKLLADILWHPKMQLSDSQKQQFISGIANVYAADEDFLTRFKYTLPLFGLRWTLILLNEFIPAFWQNRKHADTYKDLASNKAEVQAMQLARARSVILSVAKSHENSY